MPNHDIPQTSGRVEFFSKVVLGTITVLLVFGQYQLAKIQQSISKTQLQLQETASNAQKAHQDRQMLLTEQQMDTQAVSLLRDYLTVVDNTEAEGRRARDVLSGTAEHLNAKYGQTFFAVAVKRILPSQVAEAIPVPENATEAPPQEPAVLRLSEATQPPSQSDEWFAVLTAYFPSQEKYAKADVEKFLKKLTAEKPDGIDSIGLYQTKADKNYAVTIGGPLSKTQAVAAVTWAKTHGLSKTAFVQANRDWSRIDLRKAQ